MPTTLAELLGTHLARTHTSVNRLFKLSGVPQRTLANWLNGQIRKPQQWQAVVKAAAALHLTPTEADALLQAAGHPCAAKLRQQTTSPADLTLLTSFSIENQQSKIENSPFQAIASPATFVGRETELAAARRALLNDGRAAICGLRGMGGVGKTALAAHLAYQLRGDFPDGVLWARLDTADTLSILGSFADAYGKDVSHYRDVASRAAVVRGLLADKRALLVLDNAESSAQVRPLLPPSTGTCAVLITTRADLSATDGWLRLTLEPFDPAGQEALQLFEKYLGRARVRQERAALLEMAALLGHLPLALAIAAGQLAYQQDENGVASLLAALRQSAARLDALARDDLGVRATFDVSYAALPLALQTSFAALGAFGGEDFSAEAVAAVTETSPETAQNQLAALVSLSLLQESRAGRWRLHPLLRDYAREKLAQQPNPQSVFNRMVEYFIQAAKGLGERGYEPLRGDVPQLLHILEHVNTFGQPALVVRSFSAFQPVLNRLGFHRALNVETLKAQVVAAAEKLEDQAELPQLFFSMAVTDAESGYEYSRAEEYGLLAVAWARRLEQWEVAARCLNFLSSLSWYQGQRPRANTYTAEAESVARQHNIQRTLASLTNGRGIRAVELGQFAEAEAAFKEFEAYCRKEQNAYWLAACMTNLGEVAYRQRQYEQADWYYNEAIRMTEQINGSRPGAVLLMRGKIAAALGNPAQAEAFADEALRSEREAGHPRGISNVLGGVGDIALSIGQDEFARQVWQEGLEIARQLDLKIYISDHAWRLGRWYIAHGQAETASELLDEAHRYASELQNELALANSLFGLAQLAAARGQATEARRLAEESIAQFERIHDWHAEEVRAWLEEQTLLPV